MNQRPAPRDDAHPPRHMQAPPRRPHGWFPVLSGHALRPGVPTSLSFMGRPLVAFRDGDGAARVVDAICPHFGAHMGDGDVIDGRLRCPYHHLVFDGAGRCTGAPAHGDGQRLSHVRVRSYPCREAYGLLWMWHGPDPLVPDRALPLDGLDWAGWTAPVHSDGAHIPNLSPLWLAENIADLAHLRTVHCWDVDRVIAPPGERADGSFGLEVAVRWRLGARARDPRVRALGQFVNSPFHLHVRAVDGCIVVADATLTEAQGGLRVRNVVTVTPDDDGGARLRVLVSVQRAWDGRVAGLLRRVTGRDPEALLAPLFLQIGVQDFTSDARVWARRQHLVAPIPLAGEGSFIDFRRWSLRFWPDERGEDA